MTLRAGMANSAIEQHSEALSLPVGGVGSPPSTTKRVVLSLPSRISAAMIYIP